MFLQFGCRRNITGDDIIPVVFQTFKALIKAHFKMYLDFQSRIFGQLPAQFILKSLQGIARHEIAGLIVFRNNTQHAVLFDFIVIAR